MPDISTHMQSPTLTAIDAAIVRNHGEKRRTYLGASVIGNPCERALWYEFRWSHEPEQFDARMLRLFESGHREEQRMIEWLVAAGCTVWHLENDAQIAVSACNGHFGGHLDGEVSGVIEAPKALHVLECKTHNAKSFAQLVKNGVAVAKPMHMAQMQVYMHLRGHQRALYIAKNKDDDALHIERVHYDAAMANALIAKAQRIIDANNPPARISEDPNWFQCRFCPSRAICHEGAPALRNCRTCLHSSPIDNPELPGAWNCVRHQRGLSRDDQEAGCPLHLYLPGLVAGEQIDADHIAETVTYRLANGSTWIDGEGRAT